MSALPFTWVVWSDETTAEITVFSLYPDAVTSSLATVGSRNSIGEDGGGSVDSSGAETTGAPTGVALFSWVISVTGLSPGTATAFTVTQNGTTRTGSVTTRATDNRAFFMPFISCAGRGPESSKEGCWGKIRTLAEANYTPAWVHVDDHGYTDSLMVPDSGGNLRFCTTRPDTLKTAYSYAVAYAGYLGLLEEITPKISSSTTQFLDEDFIWLRENVASIKAPGDHELTGNPEELATVTAAHLAVGKATYQATVGSGQAYIDDTRSLATYDVVGPVEVICPDRVFALAAETQVFDAGNQTVTNADWLTQNQIDDIKGEINSASPFKMIGASFGIQYPMSQADRLTAIGEGWLSVALGHQQPLHDYTLSGGTSDLWKLFRASDGIFSKTSTTYSPVIFVAHGDTHRPYTYYDYLPETATFKKMDFYEFSSGTVNANTSQRLHPTVRKGLGYEGTNVVWIHPDTIQDLTSDLINIASFLSIEGTYNNGAWSLLVETIDDSGESLHSTTLKQNKTNAPEHLRQGFL